MFHLICNSYASTISSAPLISFFNSGHLQLKVTFEFDPLISFKASFFDGEISQVQFRALLSRVSYIYCFHVVEYA